MSDEISVTDIPMPLATGVWDIMQDHGDHAADPVVIHLRDAHAIANAAWKATLVGHRRVMADPTNTPMRNLQRSAEAATRRQQEALARLDATTDRARREIQMIVEATSRPDDPPAPHMVRMVADRLSSMKPDQRSKIIGEALASDQKATLHAVLWSGDAWMFGMSNEEREMWRAQYRQSRFPQALARKAALERAIELASAGGTALMTATARLIDKRQLDQAAALAQAAQDALA